MQPRGLITSRDNPLVQRLRRLLGEPAAYRREGLICNEGEHLCSAYAHRRGRPRMVVMAESAWQRPELRGLVTPADEVQLLSDRLFEQVSALPSPAGMAFLADLPSGETPRAAESAVLLDRLQDPGNVGSILRSASALGVRQVWATPGTAALWSPKVLRAGMGAHFGLTLCESVDVAGLIALPRAAAEAPARQGGGAPGTERAPWVATSSHADAVLGEVKLPEPCVWVMGHEGQGVSEEILRHCALSVRIPQPGGEESLNVAAAAAICLYESARWRPQCDTRQAAGQAQTPSGATRRPPSLSK
ncbi:MAG: TrmH family RNA methyltransferase [Rubrivivax sp.]